MLGQKLLDQGVKVPLQGSCLLTHLRLLMVEGVAILEDELDIGKELGNILVVIEVRRGELLFYCRQIHGLSNHLVIVGHRSTNRNVEWYTQLVAEEVKQDPFAYQELPSAESHGSLALGAR